MITCQTQATVRSLLAPAWSVRPLWTWARTSGVSDMRMRSATVTPVGTEVTGSSVGLQLTRTSTVLGEQNSKFFSLVLFEACKLCHLTVRCY